VTHQRSETPIEIPLVDTGEREAARQAGLATAIRTPISLWVKLFAGFGTMLASAAAAYFTLKADVASAHGRLDELDKAGIVTHQELKLLRYELRDEIRASLGRLEIVCDATAPTKFMRCRLVLDPEKNP
jgi:hypothetical protein